ncbi:hypothetical protein LWI28_017150 [Acer negundo]|uniref:Uncharacterized protein n=1 Tax=Acer negundo TaxID=4023 RepID=A0AAD5IUS9_ACENE|nr:hypothetical protein LWI28_017150 [Acer negundo]
MILRNYLLGGAVMVRGKEVRINPADINRPCSHRTTVAYEVAQLLYCLQQGQLLDIGVLIKMEIHKCGKDESKKEAMGFPSLITYFRIQAGIDLSIEEMKEPPVDIRINQWYSLYSSRGLRRPRDPREHGQRLGIQSQRLRIQSQRLGMLKVLRRMTM